MSNLILNNVICFSYPYEYDFTPLVTILGNPNRKVKQALIHNDHDWMTFFLKKNQMKETPKGALLDFFWEILGPADNFLLKDEFGRGYQVAKQSIGSGNGSLDTFQLIHTIGSRSFERWDIINSPAPQIWVDAALQVEGVDYDVNYFSGGTIVFKPGHIPAGGTTIYALYEYLRRVRLAGTFKAVLDAVNNTNSAFTLIEESVP